jgi:glycosyltransferase involved in cell wall biosynthesis
MNLLLVSPYFPPQHSVASLRTHGFARAWTAAGCRVTVLTTAKRPDQCGLTLSTAGFDVAEIDFRVPAFLERLRREHKAEAGAGPVQTKGLLKRAVRWLRERAGVFCSVRMPDLTDYWVEPALAWARKRGTWDAVVSSSGPYTSHLVARTLKREGRTLSWAADFRDLWTGHHLHCGLFPFTLREQRDERSCLAEADMIVAATAGLAAKLRPRTSRPVEVIYNGYDAETTASLAPEPFFPADGVCRLVYSGTYYPQGQNPGPLLRCLRALKERRPDLPRRLALATAGWSGDLWRAAARQHGVEDLLQDHGVLPRGDALRMQRDATALLLLDWRDQGHGILTGKVFEYLNGTAPILTIGAETDSELARLIRRSGRGLHLGNDEAAIGRVVEGMLDDVGRLRLAPDRRFLAELTRPVQSLRLLDRLRQGMTATYLAA